MKQRAERSQKQSITPQQKRIFRIVTLLFPVFLFLLLEFSLRLLHYGYDLSLFTAQTVGGKSYYTLNPSVKNRYFNGINFTLNPSPEFFLISKPPGTFRIFCLGESSTIGYPYWYNAAFPSFLRDRLKAVFPNHSIEVVNLGITATDSYTVLDLSKDVMDYDPDLLIVYDGHNEFYGMLGAASNELIAPARWITLLYLRAIHLRTYQLAKSTYDAIVGLFSKPQQIDSANRTTLMERVSRGKNVSYGSDIYRTGFSAFRENLKDLSDLCRERNVPLFLGTQVSNIRDQFPFISNHPSGIPEHQRDEFQQFYKRGLEYQARSVSDSAIACFRSGIALDSLYADIHYRLAQCLDVKGEKKEAYHEYVLARDFDELRFRTDSRFNDLIRSMDDRKHVFVADIEAVFASRSQDSLTGHNLILEHLHPNSRGHFYIAKEYARLMRDHSLLASSEEWAACDTITDDYLWEHRHVTDVDEFLAARNTEYLTSGWPFKSQPSVVEPFKRTDTLHYIAEQAARNQIDWETAHSRAIDYYERHGDVANAEKESETIINQFPLDITSYLSLAQMYFNQKEFSKAEAILLASLQIQRVPVTYRVLGDTYVKDGKLEQAVGSYEELNRFSADPAVAAENAYVLASAYLLSGKIEPAVNILEHIIDRYPSYSPAKQLLSRVRSLENAHPVH